MMIDIIEDNMVDDDRPRRRWRALLLFPLVAALIGALLSLLVVPGILMGTAAINSGMSLWMALPKELPIEPVPQRSVMLDRHGEPFAVFYDENRVVLPSEHISDTMKNAQVAAEDRRFYERDGAVDPRALARAVVGNVVTLGNAGGGSTITQQYVKNMLFYLADTDAQREAAVERTVTRKVREISIAASIEQQMDKDEILTRYLNIANYGDGAFGVHTAANHYFSTSADKLTITQAATLAGIVQNPSRNPVSAPEHAVERRNYVLGAMLESGFITHDQYTTAIEAPLGLSVSARDNGCTRSDYPYYCALVRSELRNNPQFGDTPAARERWLHRGGLTIHTALDPVSMDAAIEASAEALGNDNQYAAGVAIVQPGTGHVVGIGQNRTFDEVQLVYATSGFQNGSTFKPITLAAALEDGWDIADSMYAPATITKGGKTFRNLGSSGVGQMTAADALAVSSNTFFVKMSTEVTTVEHTQAMAERLGMDIPDSATGTEASTTLGVYDVSPVELANVYATFAGSGVLCSPTYITSVDGPDGTIDFDSACHQAIDPGIANTVAHALTTVVDGDNPIRTGRKMSFGRPTMGKTGTTTGNSAVWFVGGTPDYTTAVWIGDPRGGFEHPVNRLRLYGRWLGGVYGSTAAGPIWKDVMTTIHDGVEPSDFPIPSTVRHSAVVPDVRQMETTAAIGVLHAAGIEVSINEDTADGPQDRVVSQTPAQGSAYTHVVTLTLGHGSETSVIISDQ